MEKKRRKPIAIEGNFQPRFNGNISTEKVLEIIREKCLAKPVMKKVKNLTSTVCFLPHAWQTLKAATNYGKFSPENELEDQFFLEGYYFNDPSSDNTTTVVTHVLTPIVSSRERCTAQLYDEKSNTNVYSDLKSQEELLIKHSCAGRVTATGAVLNPFYSTFGPPQRIGHCHTHPALGVFYSSQDLKSVFAAESEPWITMVVDPRQCEILISTGNKLQECNYFIMDDNESPAEHSSVSSLPELELERELSFDWTPSLLPELKALVNEIVHNEDLRFDFRINGKIPGKIRVKGSFSKKDTK